MKRALILTCILVCSVFAKSQPLGQIYGVLKDTNDFKTLAYAQILALRIQDSVLVNYAKADDQGRFVINKLPLQRYRILVTRPGFVDMEDVITLDSTRTTLNLGNIYMITKTNLLREAIIRDRLEAIRIKGDTTEFLVDSFLTNKNANVEELMKRLPGIQVDKDGKITAQGKEVKKVLVDGEEFFGDDPTIATRNLKATQVESIQVYDKKSEQATVSGVDDGIVEKTINLKLKEDAKKGYFGKLSAAGGTDNRYENEAMFNRFNRKQKVSAYGAMSNTNKTSLSWEDSKSYAGDNSNTFTDEDGTMYMWYSNNDDFDGVGVPQTWYTGAHYSDKYKSDKHALSINFSHKEMQVSGFDSNYTQYILPDTFYFNNQNDKLKRERVGNNVSLNYVLAADSFNTLKFKISAAQSDFKRSNTFTSENRNEEGALVNSNNRSTSDNGSKENLETNINYIRKFRTKGRSFTLSISQQYNNQASSGFLLSDIRFVRPLTTDSLVQIDQKKVNETSSSEYNINTSYTEPLNDKFFIVADYGFNTEANKSARFTFEKNNLNEYDSRVDSLSNDFRYNILINRGGLALKYQFKKITTSIGGRVSHTDLRQNNLVNNQLQTQSFINYFPSARFNYKIGTSSSFELNYSGRTQQPSLQQIQPLVDNINPLDVYIGNPNLRQSFSNNYRLNYNSYKPLTGTGIWASLSFDHTYDAFTQFDAVDAQGRRTHQTINVDGNRGASGYVYYYTTFKKLDISMNINANSNLTRNVNYLNGFYNVNNSQRHSFGLSFNKGEDELYWVDLGADFSYNRNVSSLRKDIVSDFWIYSYSVDAELYLPKKFVLRSEVEMDIRQKTPEFRDNLNVTIINLALSKKFGKSKNFETSVEVRDLLNQNLGFRRTNNSNFINQNVHTVLRRYFLVRFTYNFNSAGSGAQNQEGE